MATEGAMVIVTGESADVITAVLDGGRVEEAVNLATVGLLIDPDLDGVEHGAVDLHGLITQGRVVEYTEDVGRYFFYGNPWVLPSVENSSGCN